MCLYGLLQSKITMLRMLLDQFLWSFQWNFPGLLMLQLPVRSTGLDDIHQRCWLLSDWRKSGLWNQPSLLWQLLVRTGLAQTMESLAYYWSSERQNLWHWDCISYSSQEGAANKSPISSRTSQLPLPIMIKRPCLFLYWIYLFKPVSLIQLIIIRCLPIYIKAIFYLSTIAGSQLLSIMSHRTHVEEQKLCDDLAP